MATRLAHALIAAALIASLSSAHAAPADKDRTFLARKQEIVTLAAERARVAPGDYQRTLKTGELRLHRLHDDYRLEKSTPPTVLDDDVQDLRLTTQKIRLLRARGRKVAPDARAEDLIVFYWDEYRRGLEKIQKDIVVHRRIGTPDSQLYWDVMKRHADLRTRAEADLLYNAPPGEDSLDQLLSKDEWKLLKAVEPLEVKTRGRVNCVAAAEEHPRRVNVDIAPFYQSQGLLPTIPPDRVFAFFVPVGCRTAVQRESGLKLIVRISHGKGVAHVGTEEKDLSYGYLAIPADTPYYFENLTADPLDLEYIALPST